MMKVLKFLILLAVIIRESMEESPSLDCERDPRLYFSDRFYSSSSGARLKCVFSNVNSIDEMKSALAANTQTYSTNIVSIKFNQSNISEFPERMFSSYTNLRALDGSNLKLSSISSTSLNSLTSLDFITLSFNLIENLSTKAFANRKLKFLDLSNNMITAIDESAFSGSEIEKVNLAFNKIKDLSFVNSFKFFNMLQMNNNEVEKFNDVKLTDSSWSGQRGDVLFGSVYPSINLETNNLKTFECKAGIKFAMIEIKNNLELKSIDLGDCTISQLDVSDCGNLKSVKLSGNVIGFTAKNVKFDQIDLSRAQSLESLKLVNNSLKADALDDIMKLENLTTLDISYNLIGPLNISTFAKLKKLSSLGLKSTKILNIQFGTFSHQNNVRMLDISDNNLGSFDMQMIFSMASLTYLDISGNDLIELSNVEAAHNTFALLEKIDLTNNKWTCSYLLRLIKIMRAYRVTLIHSYVEEHKSNINGIYCRHVEGEDAIIEPLTPNSSNITDIRDKMNEIVGQLTKETQYRSDIEVRLSTLEKKLNNQMTISASNDALRSQNGNEKSSSVEVRNSTLFEMTLILVFFCFIVFVSMKIFVFIRTNFMHRPRPMRVGLSEHTLTMNDDY